MGWLNFGGKFGVKKGDRGQGFGKSQQRKSRKPRRTFVLEKIVTPSAGIGDWLPDLDSLQQLASSLSLPDLHLPNLLADSDVCPIDPSGAPTNNLPPLIDFDPLGLQQPAPPPEAFDIQGAFDTLPPPVILPIDPPGEETEPVVMPGDVSKVIKFTPEMGFLETPIEVSEGIWFLGGKSPEELNLRISSSNLAAADTTNADQLWKGGTLGLNLDGSGVKVGVWDEGSVRGTHQELSGRVSYGDSAEYNAHATHVAGTIGATGVNADARGMANKVNIQSFDWAKDQEEMKTAAQNGLSLSNHSYGGVSGWAEGKFSWVEFGNVNIDIWGGDRGRFTEDQNFGKYSGSSSSLDKVLYDNPNLLSVWSSGNNRGSKFRNIKGDNTYVSFFSQNPGIAGWKGAGLYRVPNSGVTFAPGLDGGLDGYDSANHTAKNTLVVGAINPITNDPYTRSDAAIASFSNLGLTDDGRLKVDVVADGIRVTSSTSASNNSYGTWNGTSMAAPNVTGTAALLTQHYQNLYGKTPLSATLKGTILHTAFDAGNVGPDYIYGWGVVDAAAAAQFLDNAKKQTSSRLIESTYSGSVQTYPVTSNGINPLKATIVWTDPAGKPHGNGLDETTSVLVNNLDIWITRPDGTKFYPWTLNPNNPSASAVRNKQNSLDNVEQVLIDAPVAGTYTINVGHSGASFNQNYSLLISGLGVATIPKSTVSIATTDGSAAETKAGQTTNPGKVTITRSGGDNSKAETVYYTLSGTASNGVDYRGLSGAATFAAGQTSLDISIDIVDDAIVEGTETLSISLMGNSGYSLGASTSGTISIADNDVVAKSTIMVATTDWYASETNWWETPNPATFTVTRSGGDNSKAETIYYTVNGTASNGTDYTLLSGIATIPVGLTSTIVNINPVNDAIYEGTESVSFNVTSNSNYNLGSTPSGTAWIYDNDTAKSTILVATTDWYASETNWWETPNPATFTVTRSGGDHSKAETIYYTVNGTASNGTDYTLLSGIATIPAGLTSTIVNINPVNDAIYEGTESVSFNVTSNSNYNLGSTTSGTAWIYDNDVATPGKIQWIRQFGTPASEYARGLAVDSYGNAYIAGGAYTTGNVSTEIQALLFKYDNQGNLQWSRQLGDSGQYFLSSVTTDSFGNIYATGNFVSQDRYQLVKYDTNGNLLWSKPVAGDLEVNLDASGNIYVASSGGGIAKYNSSGNLIWQTPSTGGIAAGMAVDAYGNSYATGYQYDYIAKEYDSFLVKYDSSGKQVWFRQWETGTGEGAYDVAVDKNGNLYLGGWSWDSQEKNWLAKYDNNGNQLWRKVNLTGDYGSLWSIDIDNQGNLYLGLDNFNSSVIKMDSNGNRLWKTNITSAFEGRTFDVKLDPNGSVYATGTTSGSLASPNAGQQDIWLAKLNQ